MSYQLRKYITTLVFVLGLGSGQGAMAQAPTTPLSLKTDAPEKYVVVPGDTLWSIAERYTDSPWRWNELWNLNKDEIKNPHRIYPGNVIVLDRQRGQVAVVDTNTVQLSPRIRAESTSRAPIPSIPSTIIEPFLSRPLIIEADGLDQAPTVVAFEGSRVLGAPGERAFVKGVGAAKTENWFVYRRGDPLLDPDSKSTLGYEAIYLGTARTVRSGEPTTVQITSVAREIGVGDRLVAAGRAESVSYAPRAPSANVRGRVLSFYGGIGRVGEAGNNSIIALSAGKAQGLEVGNVLALHRPGALVADASGKGTAPIKLPDQRYGLVFVFRVFERVSYALVMNVTTPLNLHDVAQNP